MTVQHIRRSSIGIRCSSCSGGLPPKKKSSIQLSKSVVTTFGRLSSIVETSYIIAQIAFVRKWKFCFFLLVDTWGFEPRTSPCKGDVIPDFTTGPLKILDTFKLDRCVCPLHQVRSDGADCKIRTCDWRFGLWSLCCC